jgi:hypothetical protein
VQVAYSSLPLGVEITDGDPGIRRVPKDFADSPSATFRGRVPSLGNPAISY